MGGPPGQSAQALTIFLDVAPHIRQGEQMLSYSQEIDTLIPEASKEAYSRAGRAPPGGRVSPAWGAWALRWDHHFHVAMDRLATAHGLRMQSYQARRGAR